MKVYDYWAAVEYAYTFVQSRLFAKKRVEYYSLQLEFDGSMSEKAFRTVQDVYINLKSFRANGYRSLVSSEGEMGGLWMLDQKLRKTLSDKARIYLTGDQRYSRTDARFSKKWRRAMHYMIKNGLAYSYKEFVNYPDREGLKELGYQEIPSVKCLKIDYECQSGVHLTDPETLGRLLVEQCFGTLIANTLIDVSRKYNIEFDVSNVGAILGDYYYLNSNYRGQWSRHLNTFWVRGVDPQHPDFAEVEYPLNGQCLIHSFLEILDIILVKHFDSHHFTISYDGVVTKVIYEAIEESDNPLIKTMLGLSKHLLPFGYTSEFI